MDVVLVSAFLIAFALASGILARSVITMPLAFTALGFAIGPLDWLDPSQERPYETIHLLAEATLALVLFSEASHVRIRRFSMGDNIAARLLLVALPLSIAMGGAIAFAIFPEGAIMVGLLTAAILAPTDAALGQSLFQNKQVPEKLRRALAIESGLNDGMVVPVIIFAAAAAAAGMNGELGAGIVGKMATALVAPAIYGALLAMAVALLIGMAERRGWMQPVYEGATIIALVALLYAGADAYGGSGFIATFVGGLAFGHFAADRCGTLEAFMEREGRVLTIATFLIFGAVMVPLALDHASGRTLLLAASFLTLVRAVPVWLATIGLGLPWQQRALLGWFGPRGLPSVIFVLLVLQDYRFAGSEELLACVVMTVGLSILLHGATAVPLARRFASRETFVTSTPRAAKKLSNAGDAP